MIERLKPKKADIVILLCVLAAAVLLLVLRGGRGSALIAEITVNGAPAGTVDLRGVSAPYEFPLENGVCLYVEPGRISFLRSDCRGQDCVRCGALTRAGQAAACVPNKTLVTLTGKPPKGAPDAVSY